MSIRLRPLVAGFAILAFPLDAKKPPVYLTGVLVDFSETRGISESRLTGRSNTSYYRFVIDPGPQAPALLVFTSQVDDNMFYSPKPVVTVGAPIRFRQWRKDDWQIIDDRGKKRFIRFQSRIMKTK